LGWLYQTKTQTPVVWFTHRQAFFWQIEPALRMAANFRRGRMFREAWLIRHIGEKAIQQPPPNSDTETRLDNKTHPRKEISVFITL